MITLRQPRSRSAAALATALAAAILLAGCQATASPRPGAGVTPPASVPPAPSAVPLGTAASPAAGRPSDLPIQPPPAATVPPSVPPLTGEVPVAILDAARADLATRIGPDGAAAAEVIRAEAVAWPNGALGCPTPGEKYLEVVTPGYWIVLRANGADYDYRATETGVVRLCESPVRTALPS